MTAADQPQGDVHVVGVRHHSPACARLVEAVLARLRPARVLIEGPADMNGRLGELALPHVPPYALFAFCFHEDIRYGAWYPFCAHSPEHVGLTRGLAAGADVRFMDLPGWSVRDEVPDNRYADRVGPRAWLEGAERATGELGYDAVWDALFELPDPEGIEHRLQTFFEGLREVETAEPSDLAREEFMKDWVRWARGQPGSTLVLCGGFHAPVLAAAAAEGPTLEAPPTVPTPPPEARAATWLVPYSERRLDAFSGYAAGLSSPGWYRWAWEGSDPARVAIERVATHLRDKGYPVSTADTLAAWTQAQMLARLRGHGQVARVDFLDGLTSTWIKEALDAPVPWTDRGPGHVHTHPVLKAALQALSGDARGRLAPGTPLPPLAPHVDAELERLDLRPPESDAKMVELHLGDPEAQPRRHALERLLILGIPGFTRGTRPETSPAVYELRRHEGFEAAVVEAGSYGPTLEAAAVAKLEEQAAEAEGFEGAVELLDAALRAGLPRLSARALETLKAVTSEVSELDALGRGLRRLLVMTHHGGAAEPERRALRALALEAHARGLWLAEGMEGPAPLSEARVSAVVALRDAALVMDAAEEAAEVWRRVAFGTRAPIDLRGAALGALHGLDRLDGGTAAHEAAAALEQRSPAELGDYLVGLLALSREGLAESDALIEALDDALGGLSTRELRVALPSLRLAFRRLPSRERAEVARRVSARLGGEAQELLTRAPAPAEALLDVRAIEERARALGTELGLDV